MNSRSQLLAVRASVAALAAACAAPALAQDGGNGFDLLSADTFTATADVRLGAANGEPAWTGGGFGKLRFDGDRDGGWQAHGRFAEGALVWQPRFGWTLSGTVVAIVQENDGLQPGLSEAYLSWKPLAAGKVKFAARAGLMWPPVSLEHEGPEWAVKETITPSAINSWIGEEVKVGGAEGSVSAALGAHKLTATVALFDYNDTAGALVALRGWALHDLKALAGRKMKLPELGEALEYYQPEYSHPLKEMDGGLFNRVGYYAKLGWQGPWPVRVELFHYDNHGDPEVANAYAEWGWRTRFDHVGIVAEPRQGTRIAAQALAGRTRMGFVEDGARWVDTRFRSAFALVSQAIGPGSASARIEAFETDSDGSYVEEEDSERGWAATIAGRRPLNEWASALVELVHVSSRREARLRDGLSPRQRQTQLQTSLRLHW